MESGRIVFPGPLGTNVSVTEATINVAISVINTSDTIYTNPGDARFFGFTLGIFVIVLGTVGNGLTVWAYGRNQNLQTSFNVMIANLCFVELAFSMIIIPLQLPGYILQKSPYPEGLCSAIGYLYYSSMAASLQNLVSIAFNRYVGIVNTKKYQQLFTGRKLFLWIISIWITAPILYLPMVIGGLIQWDKISLRCAMTQNSSNSIVKIYNTILTILYQAVSLILLCVLYTAIMKKVNQVQKKLKMHKQASLTSNSHKEGTRRKKKTKKDGHMSGTRTSGTTSGEENIDDYRPSSIISGGFHFRPAKDFKSQDSAHGSDHELNGHRNSKIPVSNGVYTGEESFDRSTYGKLSKPKKRMSIWHALFRQNQENETQQHSREVESKNMEIESRDQTSQALPASMDSIEAKTDAVALRNVKNVNPNMRRKKSLSAPVLPSLEEIMKSRKESIVFPTIALTVEERTEPEDPTEDISPNRLNRSYTVGSRYIRNKANSPRMSSLMNEEKSTQTTRTNFLSPPVTSTFDNRLSTYAEKPLCNSMPTLVPTAQNEAGSHTRMGTIARKIREHKMSRKTQSRISRTRNRTLRRRHARERQLAYSSFTICVAFALCVLPTSLLHLIQVTTGLDVPASASLVVSCISWLHAVVNPFIYGYMNHLYRKEYMHMGKELKQKISTCFK